jgi:hypothetical protein
MRIAMLLRRGDLDLVPRVRHFTGLPPELSGDRVRELLPPARVLVIEERGGQLFLLRYDQLGSDVGDTWHESLQDAQEQAKFEYGPLLTEWTDVPREVADAADYMLRQSRNIEGRG